MMLSVHISRFRAAVILALALVVWSDAALASFLCPHMSGCEHGMPIAGDAQTAPDQATSETAPCCPVKPEASMDCDVSAMQCCVWHGRDTDTVALLFASDHPKPKHIVAVLPAAISAAPSLIARAHVPGFADELPYVKPVTQKKTDLRI